MNANLLVLLQNLDWSALIGQLALLLGGTAGVHVSMRIVKKIGPFLKGQNVPLRVILTVLSVLGALAKVSLTGELDASHVQDALVTLLNAAALGFGAHAVHKVTKPEQDQG